MNRFLSLSLLASLPSTPVAMAAVINLAPAGTESSKSTGFGGTPDRANDGNRDGVFGNGSVFHSAGGTGPGEWYEIDLGSDHSLDRVHLFPRTDQRQGSVRDFTIEVFNNAGSTVFTSTFLSTATTNDDAWGTSLLSGTVGQRVRLTINDPNNSAINFLTFSEFEVWGDTTPVPFNLTSLAAISGGAAGFGTTFADGIDGDLAGSYASITGDRAIYHDATAAGQGFYRLDFPNDIDFTEVQLYNRTEAGVASTTTQYRVTILDSLGGTVSSQLVDAAGRDYDHLLDFAGNTGRSVLIEETNPTQFLAFSEVRVFGNTIPEPTSALLTLLAAPFFMRRRR